jgi:hypothetical protein
VSVRLTNQQSTINNQQSTINNQQSTINNQQSTINNRQFTDKVPSGDYAFFGSEIGLIILANSTDTGLVSTLIW